MVRIKIIKNTINCFERDNSWLSGCIIKKYSLIFKKFEQAKNDLSVLFAANVSCAVII